MFTLCVCPAPTNPLNSSCPSPYKEGRQVGSGPILRTLSKASRNQVVSQVKVKPGTDIISCKRIQPTALVLPTPQTELFLPEPPHIGQSLVCPLSGGFSCFAAPSPPHSIYSTKLIHFVGSKVPP